MEGEDKGRVRGRCAVVGGERDIGCADGARWRAWTRGGSAISGPGTVRGGGRKGRERGRCAVEGGDVRGRCAVEGRERDIGCADGARTRRGRCAGEGVPCCDYIVPE